MRTEMQWDTRQTRMILSEGRPVSENAYTVRILTENTIPGFLPCTLQRVDHLLQFCYDTTGYRSLLSMTESSMIERELFLSLTTALADALDQIEQYLLDPGGISLEAGHIFIRKRTGEVRFCYCPASEKNLQEQMSLWSEYLLMRLDHEDSQLTEMGYVLYRDCTDGTVSARSLRNLPFTPSGQAGSSTGGTQIPAAVPVSGSIAQEARPVPDQDSRASGKACFPAAAERNTPYADLRTGASEAPAGQPDAADLFFAPEKPGRKKLRLPRRGKKKKPDAQTGKYRFHPAWIGIGFLAVLAGVLFGCAVYYGSWFSMWLGAVFLMAAVVLRGRITAGKNYKM